MSAAQARADHVASMYSTSAPPPMSGEGYLPYRRRLLRPYLPTSEQFSKVDLNRLDGAAFDAIEAHVLEDAEKAAKDPQRFHAGEVLRRVDKVDDSGRKIHQYYGSSNAWIDAYASPVKWHLTGINRHPDK
jgi:hypothetical protein